MWLKWNGRIRWKYHKISDNWLHNFYTDILILGPSSTHQIFISSVSFKNTLIFSLQVRTLYRLRQVSTMDRTRIYFPTWTPNSQVSYFQNDSYSVRIQLINDVASYYKTLHENNSSVAQLINSFATLYI